LPRPFVPLVARPIRARQLRLFAGAFYLRQ
jgi:hypothetical protein